MNCKNCHQELEENNSYCSACGGKIIRNRLSFKNLFEHLSETFFNYDNKLLRTFIDLLKKPEAVIESYINGVRKRYVNPISYIGIALTLSGLLLFIIKKIDLSFDYDFFNQGVNQNFQTKMQNFSLEYSSILFLLYIPIYAIASWLILKIKNYNATERIVTFTYVMAQYSIFIFLPSIIVLLFYPEKYSYITSSALILLTVYPIWILYRITRLKGMEFFGQIIVFLFFFGCLFMLYSFGLLILLLLIGEINFQDFIPQQ